MAWQGKVRDGAALPLEIEGTGGELKVSLAGKASAVQARELQPGLWLLNVDGRVVEAGVTRVGDKLEVGIGGRVYPVEIADPRRKALSGHGARKGGPTELTSPMPGKVISVLVQEGELVREGQGVVVVEAMKMENEYKAPRAGRISRIVVAAGDTIEAGAKLLRIEPVEDVQA